MTDTIKVAAVNAVSLAISVTEIENWLRVALLIATLVFTLIKIHIAVKDKIRNNDE